MARGLSRFGCAFDGSGLATLRASDQDDGVQRPGELKVSEIFESVQGEGPSAGTPCMFLRLATCNLRCVWCDTPYTWDWQRFRYEDEVRIEPASALARGLNTSRLRRLVVTGGEPMIQQSALAELFEALDPEWTIEVETNGTVAPSPELRERVAQWNVSPKLASAGDPEARRLVPAALAALADTGRAWLKIVVSGEAEWREVEALLERLAWPQERVCLMPQAATRAELRACEAEVAALAARHGLTASPRLHLELWDGARGR
jgi:7-carboxy-7-deazaguanine synthase